MESTDLVLVSEIPKSFGYNPENSKDDYHVIYIKSDNKKEKTTIVEKDGVNKVCKIYKPEQNVTSSLVHEILGRYELFLIEHITFHGDLMMCVFEDTEMLNDYQFDNYYEYITHLELIDFLDKNELYTEKIDLCNGYVSDFTGFLKKKGEGSFNFMLNNLIGFIKENGDIFLGQVLEMIIEIY